MSVFEMRVPGAAVAVDLSVGHIADLVFESGGRSLRPLHRAPWVDTAEAMPEGNPPNVARLSGDFFCAPFSRNDVEDAPPHGWPANSEWELVEVARLADGKRARFRLRRTVMGAAVEKVLTLRDGHPFLYQEHVLSGGIGAVPVAHHTMVHMQQGGRLAFSTKKAALTPEDAPEPDPQRGRSLFAYPVRADDIGSMPLAGGGTADLRRYPPGESHEDFVTLVEARHDGTGFSAVARNAENDLVLVLKDPRQLPVTMLWYSNGGRRYAPWSGRHIGVLGIEDGCSAVGHRQSLCDNAVRREGVATAIALNPGGSVAVRQVIGCAPLTVPPVAVLPDAGGNALVLDLGEGRRERLPYDCAFLA